MIALRVKWQGLSAQQKVLRRWEREYKREISKQLKKAGNVVTRKARANLNAAYPGGSGLGGKSIRPVVYFTTRLLGLTASAEIKPSRRRWANEQRRPGFWRVPSAYLPALERGGTIHRRANRRDSARPRGAHNARFSGRPWFEPAVRQTATRVYELIGQTFRVLQ